MFCIYLPRLRNKYFSRYLRDRLVSLRSVNKARPELSSSSFGFRSSIIFCWPGNHMKLQEKSFQSLNFFSNATKIIRIHKDCMVQIIWGFIRIIPVCKYKFPPKRYKGVQAQKWYSESLTTLS